VPPVCNTPIMAADCTIGPTKAVHAAVDEIPQSDAADVRNLAALVERMRLGQERALEELYDATVGKLYALASAVLRSREDAEEVVCETYAYAWANAARFDASRANALGWLLMLCRSRALDRWRKHRADTNALDIVASTEAVASNTDQPYDILSLMQQRTSMHTALAQLTPERRNLVSLAFLHGMSHQEIADAVRLPLGTVKSHVRRALSQLRASLEAM
jgi:RNA polymerase sigma factor (sigma-70 family)